jgi:hypothetical protein
LPPEWPVRSVNTSTRSPNALQRYAGTAPVTRRSGERDHVVVERMAREFYDSSKIAAGQTCHAALRVLSNRWVAILWHCLTRGIHYDEAVQLANRGRRSNTAGLNPHPRLAAVTASFPALRPGPGIHPPSRPGQRRSSACSSSGVSAETRGSACR